MTLPNGVAFYSISYVDYTGGTLASTSLNDAIDGAWVNAGMTEVPDSRVDTHMAGLSAREAAATNDTLTAFTRVAVSGNRLFMAVLVTTKSVDLSLGEADAFFDSISRN